MLKVLYILIALPTCLCEEYSCPFYIKKPLIENCGGCGICQYPDEDSDYGKCSWSFGNYFQEGYDCKTFNHCTIKKSKCKRFPCKSMFGTIRCECDETTFGQLCDAKRLPGETFSDYAVVLDIIFTPIFPFTESASISVFFGNVGRDLELQFESFFETLYYSSESCKRVDVKSYCDKWYSNFKHLCEQNSNIQKHNDQCVITINLMAALIEINDLGVPVYLSGDTSIRAAFNFPFSIRVYNNIHTKSDTLGNNLEKTLVFSPDIEYSMLILKFTYYHHYCRPSDVGIYINNNEAELNSTRSRLAISAEFVVLGSFTIDRKGKCKNVDHIRQHWRVWKVDVNYNELNDLPLLEVFDEKRMSFKPFSLAVGFYKIQYKIGLWLGSKYAFGFLYSYFEIFYLKLIPKIEGGQEQCISYNSKFLTLDGSKSLNPNLKKSEQGGSMEFYWSCDKNIEICKEKRQDYSITYSGPFQFNETYTFTLLLRSRHGKEAFTSQQVYMSPTTKGSFRFLCKKNCDLTKTYKSDPDEEIFIEATLEGESLGVDDVVWSYTNTTEKNFKPLEHMRKENTPSHILILLKSVLLDNTIYTFQATSRNDDICPGKLTIKTSQKLKSFPCNITQLDNTTPVRGVSRFNVTCDSICNIIECDENEPPVYSFYDKHPNRDDSGKLVASHQSNSVVLTLTRGLVVVEVANDHGLAGKSELPVVQLQEATDYSDLVLTEFENLKKNGSTLDVYTRINLMSVIIDIISLGRNQITDEIVSSVVKYIVK